MKTPKHTQLEFDFMNPPPKELIKPKQEMFLYDNVPISFELSNPYAFGGAEHLANFYGCELEYRSRRDNSRIVNDGLVSTAVLVGDNIEQLERARDAIKINFGESLSKYFPLRIVA